MRPPSHQVLQVAAAAGELLLRSGADVARVEETILRIARAYGVNDADTFVTPTGFFISMGADAHVAGVKRVVMRTIALDRVSAVNSLSRQLADDPIPPAEALERIRQIGEMPPPLSGWTDVLFSAVSAAACTMLVGGTLPDFGPALLANFVVQGAQRITRDLHMPDVVGDFVAGATAVASALFLRRWVGCEVGPVVAGGIMVLVPGIAFTNAIRDMIAGDLVSAGARGLEALLKAATLASGVATVLYMAGGVRI